MPSTVPNRGLRFKNIENIIVDGMIENDPPSRGWLMGIFVNDWLYQINSPGG
jgi:hypothetical protein